MSDKATDLRKARQVLVDMRRDIAEELAKGYQRGETERFVKAIADVQSAIEAVDRAIQDENHLAGRGQQ